MEWQQSISGNDVLVIDSKTYLNFGVGDMIKWIHLSYVDATGVKRGEMLPVTLGHVQNEFSKRIGKKELRKLRGMIQSRLDGDQLSRKSFLEIGTEINSEMT